MNNDEISLKWYFHPNEIVRMMRTKIYDNIDLKTDLTPNYTKNLKIGVVIGTYGAMPYIDLGLHYLKNVIIPIPPKREQSQIASRIASIFSQLDTMQEIFLQ